MHRIVILVSGRGSNAEAILQACSAERWPAQVVGLVTNRPGAGALEMADQHGIATAVVDHTLYDGREAFDAELARVVDGFAPTLVVLAGFMRILTEGFVQRHAGRMLNIHPSLLPAFPGLHTHRRAIEAGCKLAGATVHFVTPQLDHGPIIAQAVVPVLSGDSVETLTARVLQAEHRMFPLAVRWFVEGQLQLGADGVVRHAGGAPQLLLPD